MEEEADKRDELAGDLEEKAETLDPTPFTKKYPRTWGYSARFLSIGDIDRKDPHIMFLHGFTGSNYVTPFLDVGLADIGFYYEKTILGDRYAVSASPFVEFLPFITKRLQAGIGVGAAVQGRFGSGLGTHAAVAPYADCVIQSWLGKHFSIGPTVRFNYAAYGPQFTQSNQAGVLPEKSLWVDFGFSTRFNF
jgi:hypothetical protein